MPRWIREVETGAAACKRTRITPASCCFTVERRKDSSIVRRARFTDIRGSRPLTEADGPGVPLRANYSFSKIAGEAVCTSIAEQFNIPLTIIRICSTYGPEGGAPADRLETMLQGKPIRLHPDKPNNNNPIYEDDYVELGIRAMEVAAAPPIVVNWAGSETVSVEEYCAYMGQLVGVEPIFEYTADAHTPLWPDVAYMHEVLGRTQVRWRDGFRKMIEARHPERLRRLEAVGCRSERKRRIRRDINFVAPARSLLQPQTEHAGDSDESSFLTYSLQPTA